MSEFAIIEVDDGMTIVELGTGQNPEDVATENGGALIDPGPFTSYEDALDALADLEEDSEDERES
jgi:hypothetical protein